MSHPTPISNRTSESVFEQVLKKKIEDIQTRGRGRYTFRLLHRDEYCEQVADSAETL